MVHFWLRDEVKPLERRTLFTPETAKNLIESGHRLTVEKSAIRCFPDNDYEVLGCNIVESGSWKQAPKDVIVCGLKELPDDDSDLEHTHIFFAHAYKNQVGWAKLLNRFINGGGCIYDLEYLVDEHGRRVAAFGRSAGYVGMYVGIITWCHQQLHSPKDSFPLPPIKWFRSNQDLEADAKKHLEQVKEKTGKTPNCLVIGALGRCGNGAISLSDSMGIDSIKYDIEETKAGGPFEELLKVDILVNCIALTSYIPPFITLDMLKNAEISRKLSVIVDVSCDYTNPLNPLPLYNSATTFADPTLRIIHGENPVDVVSIDHLPSAIPNQASIEFSSALLPHINKFNGTDVWTRAMSLFYEKCELAKLEMHR